MIAQEKEMGDIPELFIITAGFITVEKHPGKICISLGAVGLG